MPNVLLCTWSWYSVGGDWTYVENVKRLYENHGYNVIPFSTKNEKNVPTEYEKYFIKAYDYKALNKQKGLSTGFKALKNSIISFEAMNNIEQLIKDHDIAFAHLHIIHHWLTPAIIWKLKKHNIPIIWSLHEYKLICPEGSFVTHGQVCERCLQRKFYNCTIHKCKKNSTLASLLASVDAYFYYLTGIYNKVDYYLCPSQFLLNKFKQFNFQPNKLVLTNLCYDIPYLDKEAEYIRVSGSHISSERFILYVGRIEKLKGILTLIKAVEGTNMVLKIAGTGPAMEEMTNYIKERGLANIQFLGFQPKRAVFELTLQSQFAVTPSEWYENYPFSVTETLLLSKPVVGARIGGIPELVVDGVTGLLFESGNVVDLKLKLETLWNNETYTNQLGKQAREYSYSKVNFDTHWNILENVIRKLPMAKKVTKV
jgi:glycosyltransferase involved in cell wall biosynthesis